MRLPYNPMLATLTYRLKACSLFAELYRRITHVFAHQ